MIRYLQTYINTNKYSSFLDSDLCLVKNNGYWTAKLRQFPNNTHSYHWWSDFNLVA